MRIKLTTKSRKSKVLTTTTPPSHLVLLLQLLLQHCSCIDTDCRDELEVLDALSSNFILRPDWLDRNILLNADNADLTEVGPQEPVMMIFNSTTSLNIRYTRASMWVINIARVTAEIRHYDLPRYDPALRVSTC